MPSGLEAVFSFVLEVEGHVLHFWLPRRGGQRALGARAHADGTPDGALGLAARALARWRPQAGLAAAGRATVALLHGPAREALLDQARLVVAGHAFADGAVVRMLHHLARVSQVTVWNGRAGIRGIVGAVVLRDHQARRGQDETADDASSAHGMHVER